MRSAQVIGEGRVGRAVAARLRERGVALDRPEPELVLLCVPDDALAAVSSEVPDGPWVAHVSGATPLSALDPHLRRFSLHPLVPFDRSGDPAQLDDAYAALSGESEEALAEGRRLAGVLGLRAFVVSDSARPRYHAALTLAANHLVTLERLSADILTTNGVPREALRDLLRRVVLGGFERTGPLARGDAGTLARHGEALAEDDDVHDLYLLLNRLARREP